MLSFVNIYNAPDDGVSSDSRDLLLVARCRDGDLEALAELIRLHERRIFGLIYQYVRNEEDAIDLTREVFLKAHASIWRFRGGAKVSSWLCRIAINLSIDFLRRQRVVRMESLEAPSARGGDRSASLADSVPAPHDQVSAQELVRRLEDAIGQLSPKLKDVIVLREMQGLSIEEIGQILRCSQGTVKSRIFRARERLRVALAPYLEESL